MKVKKFCKTCNKEISPKRIYCSNECKFLDSSYNKKRVTKIKNDSTKRLKCNYCDKLFKDINNLSGNPNRHLKTKHNIHTDKYIEHFTIVDDTNIYFKCPYCDWKTIDLDNKSGMFTLHLNKKHNITPDDFIEQFPEHSNMWYHLGNLKQREIFINESKDNHVTCKICKQKLKIISNSHLKSHGINQTEYKLKYGTITSVAHGKKMGEIYATTGLSNYETKYISKSEYEIVDFLKEQGVTNIEQSNRTIITPKELDIYLPDYKVAIEFNGLYTHSERNGKTKNYHVNKTIKCEQQNIQLIHIFEDEWLKKKDLVKNKLLSILGLNIRTRIYARNCQLTKNIDSHVKKEFLDNNHIQGNDKTKINYGLIYNNKLVSLMTFSKPRNFYGKKMNNITKNTYELVRYATDNSYTVVKGAERLLKHFTNDFTPDNIFSYADRRYTNKNNNLYINLGFKIDNISKPNYYYMVDNKTRLHRYNFTKHKIVQQYGGDPNLTEWDNMILLGYTRIWDCGNFKYIMKFNNE